MEWLLFLLLLGSQKSEPMTEEQAKGCGYLMLCAVGAIFLLGILMAMGGVLNTDGSGQMFNHEKVPAFMESMNNLASLFAKGLGVMAGIGIALWVISIINGKK